MPTMPNKCPYCSIQFSRAITKEHPSFGKVKHCPHCHEPVFYRNHRGKKVVVPYLYKDLVDWIIARFNQHLSSMHEFDFELGEATAKERAFAYDLVDFIARFIGQSYLDIGLNLAAFVKKFVDYVLSLEWWSVNLKSLCQLKNRRNRLVAEFYESQAASLDVDTPYRDRVVKQLELSLGHGA